MSVGGGKKEDFRRGRSYEGIDGEVQKIKMSVSGGKKEDFSNIIDLLC